MRHAAGRGLLAVVRHHEERIVDADRKADHGDDVAEQVRDRHEVSEHERQSERDGRGGQAGQEGQGSCNQRAEGDHQNAQRERQGALLGPVATVRAPDIDVVVGSRRTGDRDARRGVGGLQRRCERLERLARGDHGVGPLGDIPRGQSDQQHRHVTIV